MLVAITWHQGASAAADAAAAAFGVWLTVVAVLCAVTRSRTPEPQPAGLEMGGDEPPAVVNLLTHGWRLHRTAAAATLADLATRGHLDFEQTAPDHFQVRVRPAEPAGALTAYERQVLDLVTGLADGGVVPCAAITTGDEVASRRWFKRFEHAVVSDARARGLSRTRFSPAMETLVGLVSIAPSMLAAFAIVASDQAHPASSATTSARHSNNPVGAFIGLTLFGALGLYAAFSTLRSERDTSEGLACAGRWMGLRENLEADPIFVEQPLTAVKIWQRYVPYGVALGVSRNAARTLPLGAESRHEAWTAQSGTWRLVHIRYPLRVPPGWGRNPAVSLASALAQAAVVVWVLTVVVPAVNRSLTSWQARAATSSAGATQAAANVGPLVLGALVIVAGLVLVRATAMLLLAVGDLASTPTTEGRVLRIAPGPGARSGDTTFHYLAVDTGQGDHLRAWLCRRLPLGLHEGSIVRARVGPRLGHVRDLTLLPPVAEQAGSAPAGSPPTPAGQVSSGAG